MTPDVHISTVVFDSLRPRLNQRERVELSATIAGCNRIYRFLEALAFDPEAAYGQAGWCLS